MTEAENLAPEPPKRFDARGLGFEDRICAMAAGLGGVGRRMAGVGSSEARRKAARAKLEHRVERIGRRLDRAD